MAPEIDLIITRGKTFDFGLLYAESGMKYAPITAMPSTAPVRLTVTAHGVPDGWPITVVGVKAPAELNTDEPRLAAVVDADTLEFNDLNGAAWKALSGSGVIAFNTPYNLTGCQARAQVRDKVGGALLFSWHSDAGQSPDGLIELDIATSQIILKATAAVTAALTWSRGMYDLELIDASGRVLPVTAISTVTVAGEVTV